MEEKSNTDEADKHGACPPQLVVGKHHDMERETLLEGLHNILDDYRDGSQILREMVQNAEDAGATCFKICYDKRSTDPGNSLDISHYFKGPGLCIYNDAMFKENDWKGIKKIGASWKRKENEKLKIGRFGQGFKSVFHITDHVIVLSGGELLIIDPLKSEHNQKECISVTLKDLAQLDFDRLESTLQVLQNKFNFDVKLFSESEPVYNGTVFWFGFRNQKNLLSPMIYTDEKVKMLLQQFGKEMPLIPIFLTHIKLIEICEIDDTSGEVRMIHQVSKTCKDETEINSILKEFEKAKRLPDKTVRAISRITISNKGMEFPEIKKEWTVASCIFGHNDLSDKMKILSNMETSSFTPITSIAYDSEAPVDTQGHVFCFLPLPLSQKSLTGLPVHVNGFFSLEHNRCYVKYKSDQDQSSNALEWNLRLIDELFPKNFHFLLDHLRQDCINQKNNPDTVENFYNVIPDPESVDVNWHPMLKELFACLFREPVFYTDQNGGQWVNIKDAAFEVYGDISPDDKMRTVLKKFLLKCGENFTKLPYHFKNIFDFMIQPVEPITSQSIRQVIRQNECWKQFSEEDKLILLEYVLLDGNLDDFHGLELLPLSDGSFETFNDEEDVDSIYLLSNDEDLKIFPTMESTFVSRRSLSETAWSNIQRMADEGLYQLKILDNDDIPCLLLRIFKDNCDVTDGRYVPHEDVLCSTSWIENVWKFILARQFEDLSPFSDVPVVPMISPCQSQGSKNVNFYIWLKGNYMFSSFGSLRPISEPLKRILETSGLFLIDPESTVSILHNKVLDLYVKLPTPENVMRWFEALTDKTATAKRINTGCSDEDRCSFAQYLVEHTCNLTFDSINFFKLLQIFTQTDNTNSRGVVSFTENSNMLTIPEFPRSLHFPILLLEDKYRELFHSLGGKDQDENWFYNIILEHMLQDDSMYCEADKITFMKFLMKRKELDEKVLAKAKCLRFIPTETGRYCTVKQLFDPTSHLLQDLFIGENDRFPGMKLAFENELITFLKDLGLNTERDLTSSTIVEVVKRLTKQGLTEKQKLTKAATILKLLLEDTPIISDDGLLAIKDVEWVPCLKTKPTAYHSSLQFYGERTTKFLFRPMEIKDIHFSNLVGSVVPLVANISEESRIAKVYKWFEGPSVTFVIEHFKNVIDIYSESDNSRFVSLARDIFQYLNQCYKDYANARGIMIQQLHEMRCIPTSQYGFQKANQTVFLTENSVPLQLEPYIYTLPDEFKSFQDLFIDIGVRETVSFEILESVLTMINEKYNGEQKNTNEKGKDLKLAVDILKIVAQMDVSREKLQRLYVPIRTKDESLMFDQVSRCTFAEKTHISDLESDIIFSHHDIHGIARKLGIATITTRTLKMNSVFIPWGQDNPLTTAIAEHLEDYADGFSIPKELFQNADDAGATKIAFIYDERQNYESRKGLFDDGMSECHGPALWVYNDSIFLEKDFENILKLGGKTKQHERDKIGKFGLGFCSVYNLTDVPSLISGNTIVVLDPHMNHLGEAIQEGNPGVRVTITKDILTIYRNQFKPYEGVLGINFDEVLSGQKEFDYKGTLFRLPLRTHHQAANSKIKDTEYRKEEMTLLIDKLLRDASNLLLFSQSVREINVLHVDGQSTMPEKDMRLIFTTVKTPKDTCSLSFLNRVIRSENQSPLAEVQLIDIRVEKTESACRFLKDSTAFCNEQSFLLSWNTGTKSFHLAEKLKKLRAIPVGSVAIPVRRDNDKIQSLVNVSDVPEGFYQKSHVFCFLPLPTPIQLPVHINGCFMVGKDRKNVLTHNEDNINQDSSEWNNAVLTDIVQTAYVEMFTHVNFNLSISCAHDDCYWMMWPFLGGNPDVNKLVRSFYHNIVHKEPPVFYRVNQQTNELVHTSFKKAIFLHPSFRSQSGRGDIAFDCLTNFYVSDDIKVMDMPTEIYDVITSPEFNSSDFEERFISKFDFFRLYFLPFLKHDYWRTDEKRKDRCELIKEGLEDENLHKLMKEFECIPVKGSDLLRRPCDLVYEQGSVSEMFDIDDYRFPIEDLESYVDTLLHLEMMNSTLSSDELMNRAKSMQSLSTTDVDKAIQRYKAILRYLYDKFEGHDDLGNLKAISFIPIMQKPSDWPDMIPWKGDDVQGLLKAPMDLISPQHVDLSGAVSLIAMPSDHTDHRIWKLIGIGEVKADFVIEQLIYMSKSTNAESTRFRDMVKSVYSYLNTNVIEQESKNVITKSLNRLRENAVVYVNGQMVRPEHVAMSLDGNCSPYLYQIDNAMTEFDQLCLLLEIQNHFKILELTNVLGQIKCDMELEPLGAEELDCTVNILKNICKQCKQESRYLTPDEKKGIVIPDKDGILRHFNDICFDDGYKGIVVTKDDFHYVHEKVTSEFGLIETLQIKSKRQLHVSRFGKCFSQFGQKEKLVNRLKGIISEYPQDHSIMNELLQNADDAGATEIHFVYDMRLHGTKKTFSEVWSKFQGSALVVFNDASFTDNDLQKIQDLGEGSKQNDPMKTGQFGIGFNAVYHLTDLPSFITKGPNRETFCVMDPHNTIGGDSTGFEFNDLEELKKCYPDVHNAHLQSELQSKYGTWFRFPIRTKDQAEKSEISNTFLDENAIKKMLKTMKKNMATSILFLSNIERISLSFIKPDGKSFTESFFVSLEMSEENRRRKIGFKEKAKEKMAEVQNGSKSIRELVFHESVYEICITVNNEHLDRWLVVETFGFPGSEKVPENIQDIKLAPIGGVAKHVERSLIVKGHVESYKSQKEDGVSCFLPLSISSGLPVHINGHFVLSQNRAQIFYLAIKDDIRYVWNELLITETIANAYSSLVQAYKETVNDDKSLSKFFHCFPRTSLVSADLWKDLSHATYRILLTRSVFPVCPAYMKHDCKEHTPKEKSNTGDDFRIREWVTLKRDDGKFPAIFDDLKSFFKGNTTSGYQSVYRSASILSARDTRICTFNEEHELRKVLIDIGMKLICCPNFIFKAIESACQHKSHESYRSFQKSGNGISKQKKDKDVVQPPVGCICQRSIKPCEVIAFLNLWKESKCTSLADSEIKTVDRLLHLLNFCMRECADDISPVEGLPLLCTENLILREFKQQSDLIVTEYSDILSGSPECFVHKDLIPSSRKFEKHFRVLDLDVFTSLLPKTLSRSEYLANGPIDLSVQLQYIERVWQYINTQESLSEELKRWCIVPCKWDGKDMLVSMQQAYSLFVPTQDQFKSDNDSYRNDYLSKLSLPSPNIEIMEEDYVFDIVSSIRRPEKLIKCLHFHKDTIDWNKLKQSECSDLLKMFADAVNSYDYSDLQLLKCLPIFTTVTGQLVAIDGNQQVLVVKTSDCPVVPDGIDEVCSVMETLLLEYKESHEPLFSKLGCIPCYEARTKKKTGYRNPLAYLYTKFILPNFNLLKQEHHLSHLEFIRDELCQVQEVQIHLKDLKFIPDEKGRFRSANAYFSPRIELFAELCMPDEIPPEPFSTQEWDHFMELAGIKTEITEKKLLKFATNIQRAGVNEKSTKQSKLLLESLFSMPKLKSRTTFLKQISQINFIPNRSIDMPFLEICDAFSPNGLVSFQSAEHPDNLALCWSVSAILPDYAIPDDEDVQKMLKLSTSPALQSVISHIHKVCEALSKKTMDDWKFVENLMGEFYAFLTTMKGDRVFCSEAKVMLSQTSLIFNVDSKRFYRPSSVVLKLPEELEIPTYLSSCSECFGAFFELFRILGASDGLSLNHYCQIMKNLKVLAEDEKLNLSELRSFKMAFKGLLRYLSSSKDEIVNNDAVDDLYLLNDRNIMKLARELVAVDNTYYITRIKGADEIDFLCDLRQLKKEFDNIYKLLLRLPHANRPSMLSECTTEDVLLKESAVACDLATMTESYLTGNNCRYTIIRLLKTYQDWDAKKIDDNEYKEILEKLSRIRVIALPTLETIIFYGKQAIQESVQKRPVFFIKEENTFYIQYTKVNKHKKWIRRNAYWFAHGIRLLTGYDISTSIFDDVFPLFKQSNDEIAEILDGYYLVDADYKFEEVSWFPLPGTPVRDEDLHMLRAGFEDFSPGEHAVCEIYGEDRDGDGGDSSIYIYVKVLKKLTDGPFPTYSVNTGEELEEEVPSFRLYTLMRENESTQDLDCYADGQASSDAGRFKEVFLTVEALLVDAWREGAFVFKRVVRRLMLRWHPDKNDNSEFCGAVFKHLTSFIKRLQNGEIDLSKINAHRENGEDVWNNCMQRATGRADVMEGYQFDVDECFPNVNRGTKKRSTFYTTGVMPNPQPHMGRVWMRQAKFDLEAARSSLETATDHTFNWVCVQSHQAAEKALKAVLVSEDVSQVGNDHFLPVSVARRNPSLHRAVQALEALVVNYSRMRYPRVTSYPSAPSELYKKVQAERSVELATEIIECVDENFM